MNQQGGPSAASAARQPSNSASYTGFCRFGVMRLCETLPDVVATAPTVWQDVAVSQGSLQFPPPLETTSSIVVHALTAAQQQQLSNSRRMACSKLGSPKLRLTCGPLGPLRPYRQLGDLVGHHSSGKLSPSSTEFESDLLIHRPAVCSQVACRWPTAVV